MKTAVVYESMYGNTREVARAVADGIGGDVTVLEVGEASYDLLTGLDLLVVGGPTHVWSMSSRMSRRGARQQAKTTVVSQGNGVREWLRGLPAVPGLAVAAFDTGIVQRGWFPTGSAAAPIALNLRRKQARLIAAPERFGVVGSEGPLEEGQLSRAWQWGAELARKVASGALEVPFAAPTGDRRLNRWLGVATTIVGLTAVGGAIVLLADPSGDLMGLPAGELDDTPFDSYLNPALLLLFVVGESLLIAGVGLLKPWPRGSELAIAAGAVLVGWIVVQMTMIEFFFLQPLLLTVGLLIMVAGWIARVLRGT